MFRLPAFLCFFSLINVHAHAESASNFDWNVPKGCSAIYDGHELFCEDRKSYNVNDERVFFKKYAYENNVFCILFSHDVSGLQLGVKTRFTKDKVWDKIGYKQKRCFRPDVGNVAFKKSFRGQRKYWTLENFSSPQLAGFIIDTIYPKTGKGNSWEWTIRKHVPESTVDPKNWLGDLFTRTDQNIRLNEVCMPGTHDAGAYRTIREAETQYYDTAQQLNKGVRYLDLRVGRGIGTCGGPGVQDWCIYHGVFVQKHLKGVLKNALEFSLAHPKEIILLHFQGFYHNVSKKSLSNYVLNYKTEEEGPTIEDRLLTPSELCPKDNCDFSLKSIWGKSGKNILVFWKDKIKDGDITDKFWDQEKYIDSPYKERDRPKTLYEDTLKYSQGYSYDDRKFGIAQTVLTAWQGGSTSVLELTKTIDRQAYPYLVLRANPYPRLNIAMVDFYEYPNNVKLQQDYTFDACMDINKRLVAFKPARCIQNMSSKHYLSDDGMHGECSRGEVWNLFVTDTQDKANICIQNWHNQSYISDNGGTWPRCSNGEKWAVQAVAENPAYKCLKNVAGDFYLGADRSKKYPACDSNETKWLFMDY